MCRLGAGASLPLVPRLCRGLWRRTGGSGEKEGNKGVCFQLSCPHHSNICLVSGAERMGRWMWVFGGGRKEMLSPLNEGRFTQYNEGWTHGFTADVYLKRPGKYCFGTDALSADIHIPCNHWPPHEGLSYLLHHFYSCFFFI